MTRVDKPVSSAGDGHGKRTTGRFVDDQMTCLPTSVEHEQVGRSPSHQQIRQSFAQRHTMHGSPASRLVVRVPLYRGLLRRPHSIILASCKPGCKPGFRPGLQSGFRQVCAGLRHAFDMLATCFRHAHASRKPGLQLARIMECGPN